MALLITDPIDIALDSSGDLVIDTGLTFTSGLVAVTQGVRIALQDFKGEWFLNLDHGVPYFQEILGQKYNEAKVRRALRNAIIGVPGVDDIRKLQLPFDNSTRELTVEWEVGTAWGDTGGTEAILGVLT